MTPDKPQIITETTTRQKVIAGVLILIFLVLIWQIYGMLRGSEPAPTTPQPEAAINPNAPNVPSPQAMTPQPAPLPKAHPQEMTQQEIQMQRLQQESEGKYLSALTELQMLRVEKDIAETNKAIYSAKLDTVTSQKSIVQMLQPTQPPITAETYAKTLVAPVSTGQGNIPVGVPLQTTPQVPQKAPAAPTTTPPVSEVNPPAPAVNYTVISVSLLQNRWNAVLGFQGSLYSVSIGDILPPDGSTVLSINKTGVILEKNGVKKKVSLVPII